MAELVGWAVLALAAWTLLGFPLALIVGRRLRDHPPPESPGGARVSEPSPSYPVRIVAGDDTPVRFGLDPTVTAAEVVVHRTRHGDSPVLHTWSTDAATAVIETDPDGRALLLLTHGSAGWGWARGVYDVWCERDTATGRVRTHEGHGTIRLDGQGSR